MVTFAAQRENPALLALLGGRFWSRSGPPPVAFSQATMLGQPVISRAGRSMKVAWSSSSPDGTTFQVYLNGKLAKATTLLYALFPWPSDEAWVEVGTVPAGSAGVDFSADLPTAPPKRHATLTWTGGLSESTLLAGFNVYGGDTPGGAVDYSKVLAFVPWTEAGVNLSDWGYSSGSYTWRSGRLAAGTWNFAVKPVDVNGNLGSASTITQTIAGPPQPAAADSNGNRLNYSYNAGTRVPTLTWLASPGP